MLPAESRPAAKPPVPAPVGTSEALPAPGLLSSVCHDLKDPLASIVMGASFLRRSISPEDLAAQRVVDAIHRAANRMSQLITSFSDLAHLEAHDLTLNVQPHDFGDILKTAFERLAVEAKAHGVTTSLEMPPDLPTLPCDRDRMLQIVRYLSAAALRVIPEGGTVAIHAAADAGRPVRVEVVAKRPPGAGSRLIVSEPPKPALALARGLVALHGGSLEVASSADSLAMSFALPPGPV